MTSHITVQGTDGPDGITTLTIEPGVEVRFNSGLRMSIGYTSGSPGALVAQGTSADPIVFTSNASTPSPGDWIGIRFYDTTHDAGTIMEHCRVIYAGNAYGAFYIKNASPVFNGVVVENSGYCDVYYTGTVGGTVSGCTFNSGISLLATSSVDFTGNTFNQNNSYPTTTYADNVHSLVNGNTFANLDAASVLRVESGNLAKDATWTAAIPIYINNDVRVQGTDGADNITTLSLEPGAKLEFAAGRRLIIGYTSGSPGALVAQGTAADPIFFTSSKTNPAPGDWIGIRFYTTTADAQTIMDNCVVEYSGSYYGALYLSDAAPTIQHTVIRNNQTAGIYALGAGTGSATIDSNTFTLNQTGIYWTASPPPAMHNNNFIDNANYGIYYTGSQTLNAENNWWGDPAGPNTGGDATYGNVDGDPWLTEENQFNGTLNLPDLIITALTTDPAGNLQSGQTVTLTAAIQNNGHSSVAESFAVDFKIDGSSIGAATVNDPVPVGGSVQVSQSWIYAGGNPLIEVHANSQADVAESDDTNNSLAAALFDIADNTAPALVSTSPADGAQVTQLGQIVVTLAEDRHAVDDAAVAASFSVVDENQQPISGTVSESEDTFTFVPDSLPLAVGTYQVSLTAADTLGNAQAIDFSFHLAPEVTTVGGTISTDTTWTLDGSPYIVTSSITIQGTDGADGITTLTIEPGVTVKFEAGKSLNVGGSYDPGALAAQGTAASPIVFTSNQQTPAPGDWQGIYFYGTTDDATTRLEHCSVRYAGGGGGALYIWSAAPTVSATTIENSSQYDLYYRGEPGGLITGCTLHSGIYLMSANTVQFTGNTFHYNDSYPIQTYAAYVHGLVNGNTFADLDAASALWVDSGNLIHDATWTAAIPIYLNSALRVQGTDGADGITTLTIEPGAELRFAAGHGLQVGYTFGSPGALVAQGTAASPIIFTSNQQTPAPGDWQGIYFYDTTDDATTRLEHCSVRYAGGSGGALYIWSAAPTVSATTIENSSQYALYYRGEPGGSITGCTLHSGIYLMNANTVQFTGNTFHYNDSYPIQTYAAYVHGLLNGNTFADLDSGSYLEVASGTIATDSTWTATIPIVVDDNVIIQGTDGADGITTLTIEPGAVLRFNHGKYLCAGSGGGSTSKGALVAQGTADHMITFTSNETYPAPGDWYGLKFFNTPNDGTSRLSYVVVEYAGGGGAGTVQISTASPVLSHSVFRYSSSSGVYIDGTSSSNPEIACNTFANNANGIYCTSYTPPLVHDNNFNGHSGYAVYNGIPTAVTAENNWWGDAQGPNTGGDRTYGDVDADPWLLAPNACFTAGANHPPNTPANPYPAHDAVRAALSSGSIILQWTGGDPDLIDSVTYDLSWGTAGDALEPAAQGIIGNRHQVAGLLQGVTYYWQITARDNHGLATAGPVWHFTSNGDPPDLIVGQLTTDPAGNLQPGQSITLNATIQNIGDGPVVDPFHINCLIDGVAVGSAAIDAIVYAGSSVQAGFTWTYNGGDPTIAVIADNQLQVIETNENNNQFIAGLSQVADMTAPALIGTSPAEGAYLQQVQQIAFTLADSQSSVDDDAVIAGFAVRDATQTPVGGAVGEAGDTFTFTPTAGPLADGQYQVTLNAVDQYGNTQSHAFAFTVDSQPPAKPVITGGTVASGTIQARPVQNTADQFIIELTGTREAGTAVLIDGVERVGCGDAPWSVQIELQPGANTFEAKLKDRAGNIGEPEWVDIQMQTGRELNYEYDPAGRVKRIYSNQ